MIALSRTGVRQQARGARDQPGGSEVHVFLHKKAEHPLEAESVDSRVARGTKAKQEPRRAAAAAAAGTRVSLPATASDCLSLSLVSSVFSHDSTQ